MNHGQTNTFTPGELRAMADLAAAHDTEVQVTDMRPTHPWIVVEGNGWDVRLDDAGWPVEVAA